MGHGRRPRPPRGRPPDRLTLTPPPRRVKNNAPGRFAASLPPQSLFGASRGPGYGKVLLSGMGVSEFAGRHGGLVTVKARVELKAVDRTTDKVLAVDRQT